MPRIQHVCSACHSPLRADVVQGDEDGVANWAASYLCEECGLVSEGDECGSGLPGQEMRLKLIHAEGAFVLVVETQECSHSQLERFVAEAFEVVPAAAARLIESIPGAAYRGTREECELLERALTREGIAARVERA